MAARKPAPKAESEEVTMEQAQAEEQAEGKPRGARKSKFAELWPADAKLTVLVEDNPKKEGSATRERFEHYFGSKTVGEYLEKGGTYGDIAYDIPRGYVAIG